MRNKVKNKDVNIFKDRSKNYGDHISGHGNLGLLWTGMIQNHYKIKLSHSIPSYLVDLMMVASKICRAAINPTKEDHYIDGRVYLTMAEAASKKEYKY